MNLDKETRNNLLLINKYDNTENWIHFNPILKKGEIGIEFTPDNTIRMKVGDGLKPWIKLEYINEDLVKSNIDYYKKWHNDNHIEFLIIWNIILSLLSILILFIK